MIRIKGSKEYLVALESVAMTDIVMNMFIFFFISFSLLYTFSPDRLSKVEVSLPTSKSSVALGGEEATMITVTKEGAVYLGADAVSPTLLKGRLAARIDEVRSRPVVVRIDRMTRFTHVARVLDVMNELGIRKLTVAAVKAK